MYECHWTCQLPCTRGEATCRIYRWNYVITGIWISRKYSNIPPILRYPFLPPFSCDSSLLQSLCFLRKNHALEKNGKHVNAAEILEIVEFNFPSDLSLPSASSIKPFEFLGWKLERYIFICWKKIFGPVQLLCCLEFLRTIIKNQLLLLMSRLLNFLLPLNQADTVITLSRAVAFWLQAKWSFSWLLLRRANWRSYMKCIFLFSILSEYNCGLHIPLQAIILSWYFSSWAINIDKCWMPTRGLIPMRLSMFSHKVVVNHARIKYTM